MKTKRELRYEREKAHNTEQARAEMVRLSNELHGGGIAPNSGEYEMFSEDAPTREFANRHWGAWQNFVEFCGLELREPKYYQAKAAERRAEWEALDSGPKLSVVEYRAIELAVRLGGMGLTVKPTPRTEVWYSKYDGKTYQGQAWEVR